MTLRILFLAAVSFAIANSAELAFRSGFSNGMVLQREKPVSLSGSGAPNSELTITLGSRSQSVSSDDAGNWSVTLPAMKAGGPFTLTVSQGGKSVKLDDVLFGDVWVCSGQSNMQMGLAETLGGEEALTSLSRRSTVRFLEIPRGGSDSPQASHNSEWKQGSRETLSRFSAVGAFFAEHLLRDPALAEVPLGIINSSFGGTSIEAWSPAGSLSDFPQDKLSGSMFGLKPGTLFNQMIHPLFAQPVKGVLWYQGEANAGQPALYVKLLHNLMNQWRKGWNQPDLPFLIVQLPAFDGKMGGLDFGWLREAEIQACSGFPNAWSAVTYDTTDGLDLHPKGKEEIGRRLALIAKLEVYGLKVNAHGPRMVKAETSGKQLSVTFDQDIKTSAGQSPLGFAIAGEDGEYRFATANLSGNKVILEAGDVPRPKTVRYAWGGLTQANVTGSDGLPAFPFRTDDFSPESVVFQPMPAFQKIETPVYQLETGSAGRIASLIIGGKQFLSNDPNGGAAVPGGWGYRNLALTRVLGPQRLTLSDGGVTLEVACRSSEMTWTLRNSGNDPADLHITLGRDVAITPQGSSAKLSRDNVRLQIDGIDRVEDHRLVAKAPGHGTSELRFSIEKP